MQEKIKNNLIFFITTYIAFLLTFPFIISMKISTHTQGTYTNFSYYYFIPIILSLIGVCITNSYCTIIFNNMKNTAIETILIASLMGATLTFFLDLSIKRIKIFQKINPIYSKITSFIIIYGLLIFIYVLLRQNHFSMHMIE